VKHHRRLSATSDLRHLDLYQAKPREHRRLRQVAIAHHCRAPYAIRLPCILPKQLAKLRFSGLLYQPLGSAAQQLRQWILVRAWFWKTNYPIFSHGWRTSSAVNQSLLKLISAGYAAFVNSAPYTKLGCSS